MVGYSTKDLLASLSEDFVKSCFEVKKSLIGNDEFIDFLKAHAPIKIHKFRSGTGVYDWTIPQKWIVKKGQLRDLSDNVILDYESNNLSLLTHSSSFVGTVSRKDLEKHLFYKEDMPDAIPWMHSYFSENWGFCLTKNQYKNLTDKEYKVDIRTEFIDDFLNIAELEIKGETDRQVIITTYTCHPNMASDNVSGILLLLRLFGLLRGRKTKFTYKFFFFPETIGSLTLLSSGLIDVNNVEYALVGTCVGVGDEIHYKKTYVGNHSIDLIIEDVLDEFSNVKIRDYWPTGGSDERQLSSPKVRIPTGTIMRSPYGEFPEYHTSLDNLDLISIEKIEEMSRVHERAILSYEKYPKYEVCHDGGEPFLTKYNLYRTMGGTHKNYIHEHVRSWVLFLSDGCHNIKDMSKKSGFSEHEIQQSIDVLLDRGIVRSL